MSERTAMVLLVLAATLGCSQSNAPSAAPTTNVLLVTFDTTRADHLGCYGYTQADTPTLDALAAEGVRFAEAFSPAPITLVSHTTLLTGLPPCAHGLRDNGAGSLSPEIETFAEFFTAHGYFTAGVIGAVVLARGFGLTQGFAVYDDQCPPGRVTSGYRARRAGDVADTALRILAERPRDKPFFLWLHFFDPHDPYEPPEPYQSRFKDRLYDGEIAYADTELNRVIAALRSDGTLEHTLVVATADHGESLGEHGERTHGFFVYDATQHVPLLIRGEGLKAGTVNNSLVDLSDVMPTVAGLIGLGDEQPGSGRDLSAAIRRGDKVAERAVYLESYLTRISLGWSGVEGWRTSRLKFIEAPKPELYDHTADPGEKSPLEDDALMQSMRTELNRFKKSVKLIAPRSVALSDADRSALEALGYLGSGTGSATIDLNPTSGIDPKKGLVQLYPRIQEAGKQQTAGNYTGALRIFQNVLIEAPDDMLSLQGVGLCQMALGQLEEAERNFKRLVERLPESKTAWMNLAACAMAQERWRDAIAFLGRSIAIDPTSAQDLDRMSQCHEKLGEYAEARSFLERAIEHLPPELPSRTQLSERLRNLEGKK